MKTKAENNRDIWSVWWSPAWLTGCLLVAFFPLLRGEVFYYGDLTLQFYPWRQFASECLLQGTVPLWNPYTFCGQPFIGNGQSAFFYPPYWLTAVIAPETAVTFGLVLHLFLGSWLLQLFLRELGLSRMAATLGGLVYMLSGFTIGRVQFPSLLYPAAWVPLQLWCVHRLAKQPCLSKAFALSGSVAMTILIAHPQMPLLGLVFVLVWGLTVGGWRCLPWMLGSVGAAVSLCAIQVLPLMELVTLSSRPAMPFQEATWLCLPPWQIPSIAVPNLFGHPLWGFYWGHGNCWEMSPYVGVVASLLALVGLFAMCRRCRATLMALGFCGLVLSFGYFLPFSHQLYAYLPFLGLFRAPARFLLWTILSLSIMSAYGFERLLKEKERESKLFELTARWATLTAALLLSVSLLAWLLPSVGESFEPLFLSAVRASKLVIPATGLESAAHSALTQAILALLIAESFLLITAFVLRLVSRSERYRHILAPSLLILVSIELLVAGWGMNPTVPARIYHSPPSTLAHLPLGSTHWRVITPKTSIDQAWDAYVNYNTYRLGPGDAQLVGLFLETLTPNINLWYRCPNAEGYDPLKVRWYERELRRAEKEYQRSKNPTVFDWFSVKHVLEFRPEREARAQRGTKSTRRENRSLKLELQALLYPPLARRGMKGRCGNPRPEARNQKLQQVFVMENPTALPRAFLTKHHIKWVKGLQGDGGRNEGRNEAIWKPDLSSWLEIKDDINRVTVLLPFAAQSDRLRYLSRGAQVDESLVLVLTDVFYPGWKVFVDGRERKPDRLRAFRAVKVSRQAHQIDWVYLPSAYRLGGFATMISLAGIFAVLMARCSFALTPILPLGRRGKAEGDGHGH